MLIPWTTSETTSEIISHLNIVNQMYFQLDEEITVEKMEPLLKENRLLVGPFTANTITEALAYLDKGALQIILRIPHVSVNAMQEISEKASQLPAQRVLLAFPMEINKLENVQHFIDIVLGAADVFSGFVLECTEWPCATENFQATLKTIRHSLNKRNLNMILLWSQNNCTADQVAELHKMNIDVITPAKIDVPGGEKVLDVGQSFLQCIKTDRPDNLYTTVVTDEAGIALGSVYSNDESILAAIQSKRGVYFSRSRSGLWTKGDSSGHYQDLLRIDLDCDSDAIRFQVFQHGTPAAFCHLNTRTCWGEQHGLMGLQSTLQSRKRDAPEGSYTKRLFNDSELLRNKLLEEAQELSEAVEEDHVAAEAADLIYFTMVRAIAAGVSLNDIEKHLDRRSLKVKRRPGNAKAYRIKAAGEILEKLK